MEMKTVKSSRIKSVGYNDEEGNLIIIFKDNKMYEYFDVPKAVYQRLLIDKSPGKFFESNIKGKYPFEKG